MGMQKERRGKTKERRGKQKRKKWKEKLRMSWTNQGESENTTF